MICQKLALSICTHSCTCTSSFVMAPPPFVRCRAVGSAVKGHNGRPLRRQHTDDYVDRRSSGKEFTPVQTLVVARKHWTCSAAPQTYRSMVSVSRSCSEPFVRRPHKGEMRGEIDGERQQQAQNTWPRKQHTATKTSPRKMSRTQGCSIVCVSVVQRRYRRRGGTYGGDNERVTNASLSGPCPGVGGIDRAALWLALVANFDFRAASQRTRRAPVSSTPQPPPHTIASQTFNFTFFKSRIHGKETDELG